MHCDTISQLSEPGDESIFKNGLCVDIERLEKAGAEAQFFACFVDAAGHCSLSAEGKKQISWEAAAEYADQMIQKAHEWRNSCFQLVTVPGEIESVSERGGVSGILTVEEGGILNGSLEKLHELYKKDVRLITLTWNYENCIGSPNSREKSIMERGLKDFGFEVVSEMNRLGMIIDVSHLSDGGFRDCLEYSRFPVAASHSNARSLCPHPRNLSDDMLRMLGEKGGVVGVNFYSAFLAEGRIAGIEDLLRHIRWMVNKAGEDAVALGSDFDGFPEQSLPEGIRGVQDMPELFERMTAAGLTPRQVEKIAAGNVRRMLGDVLSSQ